MLISDWSSDVCSSALVLPGQCPPLERFPVLIAADAVGQLGDDAGEPLILGGGIEEQATQDDLAAGIEATAFGGDPGVERIEASLGLGKTFFRQFDRFGSGGSHTFSASKHDHEPSRDRESKRLKS